MRKRQVIALCIAVVVLAFTWPAVAADKYDGTAPMLCAVTAINECTADGNCERTAPKAGNTLPTFIRVSLGAKTLSAEDGRKTEIKTAGVVDGQLMLQGVENGKAWSMVIGAATGRWGGSVVEDDGAFALFGSCTLP
jgi:hypothetical protein